VRRALVLPLLAAACAPTPIEVPEGCNPLLAAAKECFLPYPSDFYRTSTGLTLSGAAKLRNDVGTTADFNEWRPTDGFSRLTLIVGMLQQPLANDRLVGILDAPEGSLSPKTSATLIIDASSGAAVPHFADLDPLAKDPEHQVLSLQPFVSLRERSRYVVGISGAMTPDHHLAKAPEGFRRLRDGDTRSDPALAKLRPHYEADIFPVLEKAGVPRGSLQLAWDFTTGSDDDVRQDLLRVRELSIAATATISPTVTLDALEEPNGTGAPGVWRYVRGEITGPLFLDSPMAGSGKLVRDASGRVAQRGMVTFPFVAMIPLSVRDDFGPARIVAFGHSFFGSRRELETDAPQVIANRLHAILISIDWWGMAQIDGLEAIDGLTNRPSEALDFTERLHQALANWITTSRAIPTALASLDGLHRPTDPTKPGVSTNAGGASNAGALLYDPSNVYFLGVSQGAILGGAIAALVPGFRHLCLNVVGAGWTQIMFRSYDFQPFLTILSYSMADPLTRQKYAITMQRPFDRVDPGVYASLALSPDLPMNPPDRRILLQLGIGDGSVPWTSGYFEARSLGAGYTTPSVDDVWGLMPLADQHAAVTVFDIGADPSFIKKREPPMTNTGVHDAIRTLITADEEMDALFHPTAKLGNPCDGPCRGN
jgi:hypothetical protein